MKLAMKMPLDNYGPWLRIFVSDWIRIKSGAGFWCEIRSKFGEWNIVQPLAGSAQRTKSETDSMRKTATIKSRAMGSIP